MINSHNSAGTEEAIDIIGGITIRIIITFGGLHPHKGLRTPADFPQMSCGGHIIDGGSKARVLIPRNINSCVNFGEDSALAADYISGPRILNLCRGRASWTCCALEIC
jgi:hypothetical protein